MAQGQEEKIAELTKLVAAYKANLEELEEELSYFRQRNANLRVAVNSLSEQVAEAQNNATAMQQTITSLQQKLEAGLNQSSVPEVGRPFDHKDV